MPVATRVIPPYQSLCHELSHAGTGASSRFLRAAAFDMLHVSDDRSSSMRIAWQSLFRNVVDFSSQDRLW